ncbi:MAG: DUF5916 domain-containing protein [Gemmatimonadaceae bacterium]
MSLTCAASARAQGSIHPTTPVVVTSTRRTSSVVLDGRLTESAWQAAQPVTAFRQIVPTEGAPATQRTEVRVLFDDQSILIGARMYDTLGAAGIRAPLARRDQLLDSNGDNGSFNSLTSDKIVIILDPYHNHLDEAVFEVNPSGVRGDSFNGDDSWDPIWEAAASVDSLGWSAEMRIPLSQLRFARSSAQTWGLQVLRYVDRLHERDMWSFRRRNEDNGAAFFGHLDGLTFGPQPRQVELLPYAVSRRQVKPTPTGDPFHTGTETGVSVGADAKVLLTTNLTLDATINPDFGQVEVDPASLNLSAYETFYDEKRPFFVAGRSAFNFGGASCYFCSNMSSLSVLYSRRIGRPPQLLDYVSQNSAYSDAPSNATILGAAKITGRTSSGYTIGLLDAVADKETARTAPAGSPSIFEQAVEPLTNYFVGRVKKELRQGATTIGAIVTSTTRRLGDDSILVDRLRSHAEAIGIDWNHTWKNRTYAWRGSVVGSNVAGSASAIALTQRSSAHYFQRPDREVTSDGLFDVRYDTTLTSLHGYGLYTRLAKENGNWLWELAQNWRSPAFETNDAAYLDRADYRWMNGNLVRQWTTPGRWYRSIFTSAGGQQQFNFEGVRTDLQGQAYLGVELPNYWNIRAFYINHPTVFDDRLTRGGPIVKRSGYQFYHGQVSTDARQRAVFDLSVEVVQGSEENADQMTIQPGVALKPASNVFIQISPTYERSEATAQYVTAVTDPTATAFSGTRYVFAFTNTRTLSLDTRVNWTFAPDVTLQLYAQPFFASGDYQRFREFAAPRSVVKRDYGTDIGTITQDPATRVYTVDPDGAGPAAPFTIANPNFSARSLRGTAVLRWEYRPGSTLYFAWTQQRSGSGDQGDFDFGRDRAALFRDRPENVFLIKATYWLGR